MDLCDRIQKRYSQIGKSVLRIKGVEAAKLAQVVGESHDRLGAFCQFCLAPALLPDAVAKSIIIRWLETIPSYLALPSPLLSYDLGSFQTVEMDVQTLDGIYEQCLKIADLEFDLGEPHSSEFSNCIRQAASSTFAFYQRNQAPHKHSVQDLACYLASYVQTGVRYGAAAQAIRQAG
jgi:hypothetical protein